MFYYEVCEIGRESVKSVNASILATLIKELVNKYEKNHKTNSHHRKYYVKCKEKLEFAPKKYKKNGDDEGFESDANEEDSLSGDLSNEDAQSTTSSCFLVDDHVFKSNRNQIIHHNSNEKDPTSLISIIGSVDSANSSGSSDTDELDTHSLTTSPLSHSKIQIKPTSNYLPGINEHKKQVIYKKEEYPIADVIFCHTEPKYPTVIAWVIKKKQCDTDHGSRLGTTGVENFSVIENCLNVIVVKCKNIDNLRDLCFDYQEYSKRVKLDQFKTIKSKKDETHKPLALSSPISTKDIKVSLSDMKIINSNLIKASELSILNPKIITSFKNDLKNSVSLNSLIKPEPTYYNRSMNQDFKVLSQSQHTSVQKTQSLMNLSKTWDVKCDALFRDGNLLKGKSLDLGDQFNLMHRTDPNGVTHIQVLKAKENEPDSTDKFTINKSKLKKEIEGVILTDVDSYAKKEAVRQRQGPEGSEATEKPYEAPPLRPERKKYLKKKVASPPLNEGQSEKKNNSFHQVAKATGSFFLNLKPNESLIQEKKIIRGPYVRIQAWGSQNTLDSNFSKWKSESRERPISKIDEKYADKRRSKSASRVPRKTPMAYRYVDVTSDYHGNPSLKCGIPPKVKEVSIKLTNIKNNISRRKSFDDLIALDNLKGNLKSVIKKNKTINDKYCEPKKVTFSAFATVQVVD